MFCIFFLIISFYPNLVFSWYPYKNENRVPGDYGYEGVHDGLEHLKNFVNEWTVEVEGGEEVAQLIALELGYAFGGKVCFIFTYNSVSRYRIC